jgi:hypothetical protein
MVEEMVLSSIAGNLDSNPRHPTRREHTAYCIRKPNEVEYIAYESDILYLLQVITPIGGKQSDDSKRKLRNQGYEDGIVCADKDIFCI